MSADSAETTAALEIYDKTVTPEPPDHMASLGAGGESVMSHGRNSVYGFTATTSDRVVLTPVQRPYGCKQGYLTNKLDSRAALRCLFTTLPVCIGVCV